jgi:hypothetical protein
MTSSASRLPATDVQAPRTGRHSAAEPHGVIRIATPQDLLRAGRHAEPAWTRDLPIFDALRDELAAVDWSSLGTGRV